jgi:phosphotransferase system enzyme I (PtsI)
LGEIVQGIPASPGTAIGPARVVRRAGRHVPHATVPPDRVEAEVVRFQAARESAIRRTAELRARVEERLGKVQAKIFDPQLLMLEDPDLIEGTLTYIRDSFLTAERAFSLRALEFRARWLDATHARVLDRVADLNDVEARVLAHLIDDVPGPDALRGDPDRPVILVAHEFTPSQIVEMDPEGVLGIATDAGTRTAHASILARSLGIPAVVGLGNLSTRVEDGVELVLDGHHGKVIIAPGDADKHRVQVRELKARESAENLQELAALEPVTRDGTRIGLHANLEMPADADAVVAVNADGIGLFRTEFLVVGKATPPDEEEQYEAFRQVTDAVTPRPVIIRTFDLGGDKFPLFLPSVAEENPFLGWRGLRVYELIPDLVHSQVRAILRAAARADVGLLVPMLNSVDEVRWIRSIIDSASRELEREGVEHAECRLGVMLETPAAIAITEILARHVDFLSLGTNDLVQYMLAVDRSNAQLSAYFDLYHPALLRYIRYAARTAAEAGRPLCVCGEAASDPLGATLLLGLGIRSLSCSLGALLEQKKLIRSLDLGEIERLAADLLKAETGNEIRRRLYRTVNELVDLSELETEASLSHSD